MSKYSHVSLIHWNQATISQYKLKWIRHAECKMALRYQQQKNWPCWLVSLSEYFENCCPKISYKWMSKGYLWVFALSDLFCKRWHLQCPFCHYEKLINSPNNDSCFGTALFGECFEFKLVLFLSLYMTCRSFSCH